jgi:sortase B
MHDMNNEDVEKTLDDINKMAKIEKIHEGDSYFDKLADEVEIEIRDVLKHEEVLNKQLEEGTSISKSKVFRLKEGQNLMFDFPPHFLVPDRGNLVDFNENIAVKVITPKKKKRKLSAKERERRKLNLLFYKLGRSVALAVMLFALGMIGEQIYGYVADHEHMIRIREQYNIGKGSLIEVTPDREIPEYPMATPPRITYPQVATLQSLLENEARNSDFVMWLYGEGAEIDYYVLQANDNEFYLKRDIDKEHRSSGSLFLDYRNRPERISSSGKDNKIGSNNIIYGHNMRNGNMFGKLKYYQKEEVFFKHQYLYTYTKEGVTVWKIFSAYETTTDDYYIQTYFSTPEAFLKFARGLQKKSVVKTDIVLSSRDDILTLSTCHRYNYNDGRFVVHAVKVGTAPIN